MYSISSRGTATEREKYHQKSEAVEKKLADAEKRLETVEGESRRKDLLALGLMILLGVAYNELLEAQRTVAEQDAELSRKDVELERMKSELIASRKAKKNILLYGLPAVVLALILVFVATKQYYGLHDIPHQSTTLQVGR